MYSYCPIKREKKMVNIILEAYCKTKNECINCAPVFQILIPGKVNV